MLLEIDTAARKQSKCRQQARNKHKQSSDLILHRFQFVFIITKIPVSRKL